MSFISINQSERYGVLPKFMYDSNRVEQLRAMTAFYRPGANLTPIDGCVVLDPSDCYISLPNMDGLSKLLTCSHKVNLEENIRRCFLFFFKRTTYKEEGSYYTVTYNNKEYRIQTNIVNSFFFWQVYNDISESVKIEIDDRQGNVRAPKLIPARASVNDGQMKILVDAVLTLDEVEVKENLNILIVGSAHDPISIPRSSYEPLFYMVTKSRFDLYDLVEEAGISKINGNVIRRFRQAYDYSTMSDYDVMLDDAWFQGKTVLTSRMYGSIFKEIPPYFSLKTFDDVLLGNIYHQVGFTVAEERRLVSRSIIPSYREESRLGKCAFCRELKFFLQYTYSDDVYKSILRQHRSFHCVPVKWYKEINNYQQLKERFDPNWVLVPDSDFRISANEFTIKHEPNPLRCLVYSTFPQLNSVELKKEYIENVAVVLDDARQSTLILTCAKALYFYDGERLFRHVSSSSIPTDEIKMYVKEAAISARERALKEKCERSMMQVRANIRDNLSLPEDVEIVLPPQDKSISRARIKKHGRNLEWREKYG